MYSTDIDIWSIGCIFAEVLTGKPLFSGDDIPDQLLCIFKVLGTPTPQTLPHLEDLEGYKKVHPVNVFLLKHNFNGLIFVYRLWTAKMQNTKTCLPKGKVLDCRKPWASKTQKPWTCSIVCLSTTQKAGFHVVMPCNTPTLIPFDTPLTKTTKLIQAQTVAIVNSLLSLIIPLQILLRRKTCRRKLNLSVLPRRR